MDVVQKLYFWQYVDLTAFDAIGLLWFFILWLGYQRYAYIQGRARPSLMSVMAQYRRDWWANMVARELRVIDTGILTNLSNSATFFASTTLFILGGLLALLGTTDKIVALVQGLPFHARVAGQPWELKILLLVGIFVYAFFKFTWALRQFGFSSVLVGAAPKVTEPGHEDTHFIKRAARLSTLAAESFNYGLRAYYFGLAALSWFVSTSLFIVVTTWVVLVLYIREFRSPALRALTVDKIDEPH
ncbi:MAG: DUF599 family protein [Betaproteobacteria bacterium]|nr:DUF599 family protein [Betaproteobacteria bacterium]